VTSHLRKLERDGRVRRSAEDAQENALTAHWQRVDSE
jgi:hypothetical protein